MKNIFCFILVLCLAVCAEAVMIVEIKGVVTSIEERGGYSFDESIQVGTIFTETYYFSDLTDSSSDPEVGKYVADYSVTLIGNYIFTSSEVKMLIECYDAGGYSGESIVESDGIVYIDSVPYEYNSIDWGHPTSYFYLKSKSYIPDSDEFPTVFPDITVFDKLDSWGLLSNVNIAPLPDGIFVEGEVTSIEVIPEPCSLLLLGLGVIGVLRRRRVG